MDEREINVKLKMTDNRTFEIKIHLTMLVIDVKGVIENVNYTKSHARRCIFPRRDRD